MLQIGSIEIVDIISERIAFSSKIDNRVDPVHPSDATVVPNTDTGNQENLPDKKDE